MTFCFFQAHARLFISPAMPTATLLTLSFYFPHHPLFFCFQLPLLCLSATLTICSFLLLFLLPSLPLRFCGPFPHTPSILFLLLYSLSLPLPATLESILPLAHTQLAAQLMSGDLYDLRASVCLAGRRRSSRRPAESLTCQVQCSDANCSGA